MGIFTEWFRVRVLPADHELKKAARTFPVAFSLSHVVFVNCKSTSPRFAVAENSLTHTKNFQLERFSARVRLQVKGMICSDCND